MYWDQIAIGMDASLIRTLQVLIDTACRLFKYCDVAILTLPIGSQPQCLSILSPHATLRK